MLEKAVIEETIYELNEIFGEDNPEGYSFTYETNGWYECIKFNEHLLWDTEDTQAYLSERPDWDEDGDVEDDHDEDIVGCIKRRFNDFINQLKGYRFDVKSKKSENINTGDMVDAIFAELDGRKGFEMYDFDDDIQDEIFHACVNIVEKNN